MKYTLKKYDRLTFRNDIQDVFEYGKVIYLHPIKLVYCITEKKVPNNVQCGFSVSKKFFLRANKRNRVKRLMKTCYRLQKHHIHPDKTIKMMMLYTHKEIINYQEMFQKIGNLLSILNQKTR